MLSTWKMVYIYILYKESMRIDWVIGNYLLVFKSPKLTGYHKTTVHVNISPWKKNLTACMHFKENKKKVK